MQTIKQTSTTLAASVLFSALRRVNDEIERSDSGHAALLVAVGAKLIAHDAAIALIGEAEWYDQLRRYARLAEEHRRPLPFDSAETVESLLNSAIRGWPLDFIEAAKVMDPSRRQPVPTFTLSYQKE